MNIDPSKWYSEEEARRLYGLPPKAFSRRLNDGRLRFVQLAKRKRLVQGQAIIDDLLASSQKKQPSTGGTS